MKNLQNTTFNEPFMQLKQHSKNAIQNLISSVTPVHPSLLTHSAGKLLTSGVKAKYSCQQVRMTQGKGG